MVEDGAELSHTGFDYHYYAIALAVLAGLTEIQIALRKKIFTFFKK